jgi:hypothetical protein
MGKLLKGLNDPLDTLRPIRNRRIPKGQQDTARRPNAADMIT